MFEVGFLIMAFTFLFRRGLEYWSRSLGSSALALLPIYYFAMAGYVVGITVVICSFFC